MGLRANESTQLKLGGGQEVRRLCPPISGKSEPSHLPRYPCVGRILDGWRECPVSNQCGLILFLAIGARGTLRQ